MKHSMGKRLIAVLLCLAVFAGSELTGATNLVGDLFAGTTEEPDRGAPLEYNTANISLEDPSDDADIQEGDKSSGADDQSGGQSDDKDAGQDDAGTGNEDGSDKGGENNGQTGVEDGSQQDKDNNNNNNDNNIGGDDSSDETESNDDADENQNGGDNKENNAGGENTDSKADGDEKQEDAEPSGTDGDQEEKPGVDADADNAEQAAQPALDENTSETENNTAQEPVVQEPAADKEVMMAKAKSAEEGTLQQQITVSEETDITISLDKAYAENLIIPDGKVVTIDLNGQKLQAVREDTEEQDQEKTLNMITVYGTLILTDSAEGGCLSGEGLDNIRAVTVASSGNFTLENGTITDFSVTGNGAGVRVEENGHFTMNGGTIEGNTAAEGYGGGVFAYSSEGLELTAGLIRQNEADYGGGLAINLMAEEPLTIPAGIQLSENKAAQYGGGLFLANAGALVLNELTVDQNTASFGGGIWFDAATDATLNGCTIENNIATAGNGGGIGSAAAMTLHLAGGKITGNTANEGNGGAVYLEAQGSTLNISDECEISGNQAKTYGGGIALVNNSNPSTTLTIEDSKILDNKLTGTTDGLYGGGVMTGHYANVTIAGSEISGNSGATRGGGLFVWNYGELRLIESTISRNTVHTVAGSSSGGGIYKGSNGTVFIKDCTVTRNGDPSVLNDGESVSTPGVDPRIYGGGIRIENSSCTALIVGDTVISENKANYGGGLYGGTVTLQDTEEEEPGSDPEASTVRVESNYAINEGGGIKESMLTLKGHVKVRQNASTSGGGIFGGTTYLYDEAAVEDNESSNEGGGIYGTVVMEGGFVRNNRGGGSGGGIRTSNLTMSGGEISGNTAKGHGGGIYYWYNNTFEITGGRIVGNQSTGEGGGIYVSNYFNGNKMYEHTFRNAEIQDNTSGSNGGGIRLGTWTKLNLINVSLTGNKANNGGGLYTDGGYKEVYFTDCEVHDNQASAQGRDIYVRGNHVIDSSSRYAEHHYAWIDLPKASEMNGAGADSVWMDETGNTVITGDPGYLKKMQAAETAYYDEETGKWVCEPSTPVELPAIALTFADNGVESVAEMDGVGYSSVQAAVEALKADPETDNVIKLLKESREDVTIPAGVNTVLDLNGQNLRGSLSSVIHVESEAELTIRDTSASRSGTIQDGRGYISRYTNDTTTRRYGGGLFIEGKVTLESGTIRNNTANYGSAVYICDGGEFQMVGGSITENRGGEGAVTVYRREQNAKWDDGVATFRMTGGEISNNAVRGVRVEGHSEFQMTGGEIKNHSTGDYGTGVFLCYYAHFTMEGGRIINNTTTHATGAAGVYAQSYSQLDLTGGEITANKNTNTDAKGAGIVFSCSNNIAYLNLNGTKVSGNISGTREREIYIVKDAKIKYLQTASSMTDNIEDCWYDEINKVEFTETLENQKSTVERILAVRKQGVNHEDAARIGDTRYSSVEKAIKAAADGDIIYLMRDVTESVRLTKSLAGGKEIVIDLNGHQLSPESAYIFYLQGVNLTLQDIRGQQDSGTDGGLVPLKGGGMSRAIYIYNNVKEEGRVSLTLDGITVSGFQGMTEGGALYAYGPADVMFKNCTIKNCSAADRGGAVSFRIDATLTSPYTLTIEGSYFEENTVNGNGGAVYAAANDAASRVGITGTTFVNNSSRNSGGGFFFDGNDRQGNRTEVELSDVIFNENHAGTFGGGAYVIRAMSANFHGVKFMKNEAQDSGGGLRLHNWRGYGQEAVLENCSFEDNTTVKGSGGGFYSNTDNNSQVSDIRITGTIFTGNHATNRVSGGTGGGLYAYRVVLSMDNSDFVENEARSGGGAYVQSNVKEVSSVISDCTFTRNSALQTSDHWGGGLYVERNVDVKDSEFDGNTAYWGGGLMLNSHKGEVENVFFHDNQAYHGAAVIMYSGYNEVTDPASDNYYWTRLKGCEIRGNKSPESAAVYASWGVHHVSFSGLKEEGTDPKKTVIADNEGRGIYIEGRAKAWSSLELLDGTEISGNRSKNSGAGIYALFTNLTMEDGAVVKENTSNGSGGGLYMDRCTLDMTGGTFVGNKANHGGAICVYGNRYATTDLPCTTVLNISGGTLTGNTAVQNGGAIYEQAQETSAYGKDPWVEVNLTGGTITGNTAGNQGGGVYTWRNNNHLSLQENAKLYGNKASLGQDVYATYHSNYSRSNRLDLMKASDMFREEGSSMQGVSWLDEARNASIEGEVRTNPSRYYALTLLSETKEVAAYAGTQPFISVQAAVNYVLEHSADCVLSGDEEAEGQKPVVTLAQNVSENVMIPAEFDGVLNLNGYTLRGYTTAVDCYGTLRICDAKLPDSLKTAGVARGKGTGTITGSAPEYGGGVRVRSGGYAVLESGQISGCQAAVNYNNENYGGAAVCADAGTFELTGEGRITGNTAYRGAAVYVRNGSSRFLMTGGEITDNKGTADAVVYNHGGTVQITGGRLSGNTANYGGAVYNHSGVLRIAGGEQPVEICDNAAANRGGAIYLNSGTATLGSVLLHDNQVTGAKTADIRQAAGGAIYHNSGTMTISDGVRIYGNRAVRGGAIYQNDGTIRMMGGFITKNRAQMGGGVAQYPETNSRFIMVRGGVYDNRATLSGAGNDFYSRYEGTNDYGPTYGTKVPELTLPAAVSMGEAYYNVWKDDSYQGENRTGVLITTGQYVTANITQAFDVQLTAAHYNVNAVINLSSDMKVSSLFIEGTTSADGKTANGMIDGYSVWDNVADMEKTAKQMLAEGSVGYTESSETYLFNGTTEKYIEGPGGRYEQEQMVQWSPGDDSCSSNTLIRTFDKVTYTLNGALVAANPEDESGSGAGETGILEKLGGAVAKLLEQNPTDADGDPGTGDASDPEDKEEEEQKKKTVHVWLEAKLSCAEDQASFVTSSLKMDAYSITPVLEDGKEVQYLRGYWTKEVKSAGEMFWENIEIQINGASNGDTIKPTFRAWVEGNEANEKTPAECASRILTVSASSSSRYNVSVDYNKDLSYTGYFNLRTGEEVSREDLQDGNGDVVYGTVLGYGMTVELYNRNASKGLKGIETSTSSVEFDLNLKGGLYLDGEEVLGSNGQPVRNAPYIWAYKENVNSDSGVRLNGMNYDQNMDWNDEDDIEKTTSYAYNAAPFNSGGGDKSCYSGGSWSITGDQPAPDAKQTTVHVKVNGYDFDYNSGGNPTKNSDGKTNAILQSPAVKAFSAGYVQVVYPLKEEDVTGKNGFLNIAMDAAVSSFKSSDSDPENPDRSYQSEEDLKAMADYYGMSVEELQKTDLAVNEAFYSDNCSSNSFGMYVWTGGGDGNRVDKNNYFLTEKKALISGEKGARGDGNTPLDSTVYISGTASYHSVAIRTDDEANDPSHYIPDDKFDSDRDNKIEYNYMTALNILQKFDAEAYTPVGTEAVVGKHYQFGDAPSGDDAFQITSSETAATWSSTATRECDLTILYAAKPDGANWSSNGNEQNGIAIDMDRYREENLLYFTTMEELKNYFAERGNADAKCVAILYEFRNACIRNDRTVTASCKMKVTDDINCTGGTYCTTNDMRCWSTYRPVYKDYFEDPDKSLSEILYQFRWEDMENGGAYGAALTPGNVYHGAESQNVLEGSGYDAYFEKDKTTPEADRRIFTPSYWDGYKQSQYVNGSIDPMTHNGWYSGNTLLLYTLDTSIVHTTADVVPGSNGKLQTSYDIAKGERIANFLITPSIKVSSAVTDHELVTNGSQKTEVTIEIDLPTGLTYNPQSIRYDYSKCGYKDGELYWSFEQSGNQLYLRTTVTDISKGLPRISYSCKIGDEENAVNDVRPGSSLTAVARIEAVYQEVHRLASESHKSEAQIQILKSASNGVWLDVEHTLVEIGEELAYNLHFTNNAGTDTLNLQLCDVLPYVGDGRGTSFQGGYQVTGVSVKFNSQADYEAYAEGNSDFMLRSAVGKIVPGTNSEQSDLMKVMVESGAVIASSKKDDANRTVEFDLSGLTQKATDKSGIALYGKMPKVSANSGFVVTVKLSPKTTADSSAPGSSDLIADGNKNQQKGADIYQNSFFYMQGSSTAYSNQYHIQAVGRTVSGTVWMDQNQDGNRISSEAKLGGIDVILKKKDGDDWIQAVDVLGTEMKMETADDGTYMFENLPAGEYTVWFRDENDNYRSVEGQSKSKPLAFGQLSTTASGVNLSNRATGRYTGTDTAEALAPMAYASLENSLNLPTLDEIQSAQYAMANQDCGLYYTDLTLQKKWANLLKDPEQGTSVTLRMERTCGDVTMGSIDYTLTQGTNTTVSVTGEGTLPEVKVEKQEAGEGKPYICTWTLEHIALQAKGAGGEVQYKFSEPVGLSGYRKTETQSKNPNTKAVTFTAENRQLLYTIGITKVKEGTADALNGAGFGIYKDQDCKDLLRSVDSGDTSVTSFANLPVGTYYVRETKAPAGYALNSAVFEVVISYEEKTGPSVQVRQISDQITGAELKNPVSVTFSQQEEPGAIYKIAFQVEDQILYALPSTGGSGTAPYRIGGLLILLLGAGLFEYYRKRRREVA